MSKKLSFLVSNNTEAIPNDKRLIYYLNNVSKQKVNIELDNVVVKQPSLCRQKSHLISFADFDRSFIFWYCKYIVDLWGIRKIRVLPWFKTYKSLLYLTDVLPTLQRLGLTYRDCKFLFYYGESGITPEFPVIRKSRQSSDRTSVIFKMGNIRLFAPCLKIPKYDINWENKKGDVVWRGATTGGQQRVNFVKRYFNLFNIGFATVKQKPEMKPYMKKTLSFKEQLKYKFLISLEGNDVASNLRWALFSNSVVIMPKPHWNSWVMEAMLQPYVHYIPLNDNLDNLEEVMAWCAENDQECQRIAERSTLFMHQFFDEENEGLVKRELLKEYAKRITFNKVNH